MKHYDIKPSACPECGDVLDVATVAPTQIDKRPEPGDLNVCFHCGELLEFDETLSFIRLRPEVFEELDPKTRFILEAGQQVARELFTKRPPA